MFDKWVVAARRTPRRRKCRRWKSAGGEDVVDCIEDGTGHIRTRNFGAEASGGA